MATRRRFSDIYPYRSRSLLFERKEDIFSCKERPLGGILSPFEGLFCPLRYISNGFVEITQETIRKTLIDRE
jgi:hypothetical protein